MSHLYVDRGERQRSQRRARACVISRNQGAVTLGRRGPDFLFNRRPNKKKIKVCLRNGSDCAINKMNDRDSEIEPRHQR
jgi:hypothetical protein